jgi:hypothetical protein
MTKPTDKNAGQMRIIEALLASFIILFAITFMNIFATTPTSPTYEIGELEKIGYNVLHDLDEQRLLPRFVYNQEWANLTLALLVSLPTDIYFDLKVSFLNGSVVNHNQPIRYGSPEVFTDSSNVASVTYILPGYNTTYDPRILVLLLVRG